MKNPCTRDCPDRAPGCNCEKRKAWKFQRAQAKDEKERRDMVRYYFRETGRRRRRRCNIPKK